MQHKKEIDGSESKEFMRARVRKRERGRGGGGREINEVKEGMKRGMNTRETLVFR